MPRKRQVKGTGFGRRLLQLRRERGWSQPQLAEMIGTSGPIIGRYERDEITPSIEVARKLAEAFGVTLDLLVTERDVPQAFRDAAMVARLRALEEIPDDDRSHIVYLLDGLIRDAKARLTYQSQVPAVVNQ
jgi:transcriptional regulator with XRE-family HTH domain